MKIFSANKIREWDAQTMREEGISSEYLIRRAAGAFTDAFLGIHTDINKTIHVFCGPGNNGADGLVIASNLHAAFFTVKVWLFGQSKVDLKEFSPSFAGTFRQSKDRDVEVEIIRSVAEARLENLAERPIVVIDALFGTGLNRPLEGEAAFLVEKINALGVPVLAVDIPSGLFSDSLGSGVCIRAQHTFTFQQPKIAFFFEENAEFLGNWQVLDIGLSANFKENEPSDYHFVEKEAIQAVVRPRPKFAHKGTFGKAALIGGTRGMMGALVLATRACLRSGVGLVTAYPPRSGRFILQISAPEAMTGIQNPQEVDWSVYSAVGVGMGWGRHTDQVAFLKKFLKKAANPPLLLDADALNILAEHPQMLADLPHDTILTPHVGEFSRIFGAATDSYARLQVARVQAMALRVIIVLKGAHTAVVSPTGKVFFNSSGNPGMAKGGMGDVLAGLITGLLAQGYAPVEAATLGVWQHGNWGDEAAAERGQERMTAGDLVN